MVHFVIDFDSSLIFQQLLRLVCRLDEENICKSHTEMPDCHHSDRESRFDSDAEVDGMIDDKDLDDVGVSSDITESSSPDTDSSDEY